VKRHRLNVFVNVPFDDDYAPLFDALIFTITTCGYRVRCALEESDSGDIRLDKLAQLISASPRSIHDLSRVELGENELPRFNMPFELGMAIGAKRFGSPTHRADRIKIMVAEPYKLPAYLSDLGGNDPDAHHADPSQLIRIVRNFSTRRQPGRLCPDRRDWLKVSRSSLRDYRRWLEKSSIGHKRSAASRAIAPSFGVLASS
jgi:hypothetical protein